eukprot:TRINITY_DN4645_c0_g2_i10.p1 TRINITY_DN4645_c0_g2~~TRINITY_DN4645_c0_g2_i10.p1  ORF type:complete len:337 (+),score=88.34 TRINITY_DN4645_c0_g2_i10:527-1537(+)
MEDLTFGYDCACTMDIKIGAVVGEDSNFFKKSLGKDKKTTATTLGLKLISLRYYNPKSDQWKEVTRSEANQIHTSADLEAKIQDFFKPDLVLHKRAINSFLVKLNEIQKWLEGQSLFKFCSSSLLFVYEGNTKVPFKSILKLVDVTSVQSCIDGSRDEGFSKGVQSMIEILNKFLNDQLPGSPRHQEKYEVDDLFIHCGAAKRRGDIGGPVFAIARGTPVNEKQARVCVWYLLAQKIIETKRPGPGINGDIMKAMDEGDGFFVYWVYGGGTYPQERTGQLQNYHYYFGVEVKKRTGEIRLVDCTDEQWYEIEAEYGKVGQGTPKNFIGGETDAYRP